MIGARRVLVTGSSRGIGCAIAEQLAKDGFVVTVHCRGSVGRAEAVVKRIEEAGGKAHLLAFDVTDDRSSRAALERDLSMHGAYYGLVLNAGKTFDKSFPALSPEGWREVIDTSLMGFYNVVHPLILPMIRLGEGGRIVTISSVSGVLGIPGQVNYSAAKAGLIGATKALAVELAKRSITVNCVAPGPIETEMLDGLDRGPLIDAVPMKRVGQPEEVAAVVSFLMSNKSSYVTRQVIGVNGGMI